MVKFRPVKSGEKFSTERKFLEKFIRYSWIGKRKIILILEIFDFVRYFEIFIFYSYYFFIIFLLIKTYSIVIILKIIFQSNNILRLNICLIDTRIFG